MVTHEDCPTLHSAGELGWEISCCPSTTSTKHPPLHLSQQALSSQKSLRASSLLSREFPSMLLQQTTFCFFLFWPKAV